MRKFLLGVVEGFYGLPWPWPAREAWLEFLAERDFNCYIYAPKTDGHLRDDWSRPWPQADFERLRAHAERARALGLHWGVGFTPLGLTPERCASELPSRMEQICELEPDIFWLLFDDQTAAAQAAANQVAIAAHCRELLGDKVRMALCPTWYSLDPQLESKYGKMPRNYLRELGERLPPEIDILWTGELVCAPTQPLEHYERMQETFRRPPLLWDNFPVNDGKRTRDFLHLGPFEDRHWKLEELCAGHVSNPMNQAWLSMLPLATLAEIYARRDAYDPREAWKRAVEALSGPSLAPLLERDAGLFSESGLSRIEEADRSRLEKDYAKCAEEEPAAAEILKWLNGDYAGDNEDFPA